MNKQFTMSMYASAQDLYEAKSKYYMEQCEQLQKENDELKAHVERLRDALATEAEQFKAIRCYTQDGKLAAICADHEDRINKLIEETQAQSLRHIELRIAERQCSELLAQVEEETIGRCILEWREKGYLNRREMQRKYKEQSDED